MMALVIDSADSNRLSYSTMQHHHITSCVLITAGRVVTTGPCFVQFVLLLFVPEKERQLLEVPMHVIGCQYRTEQNENPQQRHDDKLLSEGADVCSIGRHQAPKTIDRSSSPGPLPTPDICHPRERRRSGRRRRRRRRKSESNGKCLFCLWCAQCDFIPPPQE